MYVCVPGSRAHHVVRITVDTAESLFCRVQPFPTASVCTPAVGAKPRTHSVHTYAAEEESGTHLASVRFFIDVLILAVSARM